ncbi:hypothetical protein DPEC_G00316840 [Dallia pectoralis]|uniref:Uncharacterized protein n=1 Tax=Dallia pectoralis TaxID=75939 RepID=A0ACC2FD38_DALPE|nr:hypothetical protein DPEC_G00316840 [Dallia pectoralis]
MQDVSRPFTVPPRPPKTVNSSLAKLKASVTFGFCHIVVTSTCQNINVRRASDGWTAPERRRQNYQATVRATPIDLCGRRHPAREQAEESSVHSFTLLEIRKYLLIVRL